MTITTICIIYLLLVVSYLLGTINGKLKQIKANNALIRAKKLLILEQKFNRTLNHIIKEYEVK